MQPQMKNGAVKDRLNEEKGLSGKIALPVLIAISFSHLLNDAMQSLIPAIYPNIKGAFNLDFVHIGIITLTFQLTASIFQPVIGHFTDRKPKPYSLAGGMGFTLAGLVLLSLSHSYEMILFAVGLIGVGSSVFHPEAARVAYLVSTEKRGTAQSIFQLGGRAGASIGPLLAALIITGTNISNIIWFSFLALAAMLVLTKVGAWYKKISSNIKQWDSLRKVEVHPNISKQKIIFSIFILLVLIFSKYFYIASISSYLTFYLISKFNISIQSSQIYLFVFSLAIVIGTMIGGPLSDRFGRKYIIWISILGSAPFTLLLPHADLFWTTILLICVGVILASAFPAILVYAQELLPAKVGMISGLFYGFAFGMGGIGSAALGELADKTNIFFVYQVCAFLPLLGLLTGLLPNLKKEKQKKVQ
jgi:FSR family fosmidomycin resistance protein-like MFS transporter